MVDAAFQGFPDDLRAMIELVVEDAVERRLREILGDPDEGHELRDEVVQRLREQQKRVATGDRGRPMDDVMRELGIE